jgi:hypothetical protein
MPWSTVRSFLRTTAKYLANLSHNRKQDSGPHPRSFPLGSAIVLPIANVTSADAQVIIGVNQIALIAAGTWRYFSIIRNCNGLAALVQRLGTTEVMATTPAKHSGNGTFPIPEPVPTID